MPITRSLTYEQIRTAIGANVGAVTSTMTGAGSIINEVVDESILGGSNEYSGRWVVFTSGSNDGEIRQVRSSSVSSNVHSMSIAPSTTALATTASGDTYEIWPQGFNPNQVIRFANQAIYEATGRTFDPVEDISLKGDYRTARYDIPTTFEVLTDVQHRSRVTEKVLDNADDQWTQGTNVEAAVDTELRKVGSGSNKLSIGSVSAGAVIAYEDITSVDISRYTHAEWWARASFDTTAADYKLLLDDTSGAGSAIELLDFPALTADTWTFVRVELDKADEDTAIASVGIEDEVGDNDNQTLWIDDVRVTQEETSIWATVPRHLWRIDTEARGLVLSQQAIDRIGYDLIKLRGGDNPLVFSADSTVNEVDDQYVIAKTTGLAFMANAATGSPEGIANARQGAFWLNQAGMHAQKLRLAPNSRTVT